jgi:hypothetical protein
MAHAGLVLPRRSRTAPLLVGIDGLSRSGKSTLAAHIARCIKESSSITHDVAWHHSFFGWSDVLIEGVLRPLRRDGLPLSYTPQPWTRASAVVSGEYPVSSDEVRVCLRVRRDGTARQGETIKVIRIRL